MLHFCSSLIKYSCSGLYNLITTCGRLLHLSGKWVPVFGAFGIYFHYDFFGCSSINFYHKQGIVPLNGTNISCREIWKDFLEQLFYAPRRYYPTPYAVFNWSQMMVSCNLNRIYDVILAFRLIFYRPGASQTFDKADQVIANEAALQFEYQRSHFVSASCGCRIELKYLTPRWLSKQKVQRSDVKMKVSKERRGLSLYASSLWRAAKVLKMSVRSAEEAWKAVWLRDLHMKASLRGEEKALGGLFVRREAKTRSRSKLKQLLGCKVRTGVEDVSGSSAHPAVGMESRRRQLDSASENLPHRDSKVTRKSERNRWLSEKSRSFAGGKIQHMMRIKERVRRWRGGGVQLRMSRSAKDLRTIFGKLEISPSRKQKLFTQNTGVVLLVLPTEMHAEQSSVRFVVEDLVQRYGFAVIVYDFKLSRRIPVMLTAKSLVSTVDQALVQNSVDNPSKMSLLEQSRVMMRNTMAIGGLMPSAPDKWALGALATKQLHQQQSLSYPHDESKLEVDVKDTKRQNSTTKRFFNNLLWKSKKNDNSLSKGAYSVKDASSTEEGLTDPLRSESMDCFPLQLGRVSPRKKKDLPKIRRKGPVCKDGDIVDQVEQLRALLATLCSEMKPTGSVHLMTLSFGAIAAIASVSEFGTDLLGMLQKKEGRRSRDANSSDESAYQLAVRKLMEIKDPEGKTSRLVGKHTTSQLNNIRAHLKSVVCISPPTCLPRTLLSLEMEEHQLVAKVMTASCDRVQHDRRRIHGRFHIRPMRERWISLASHFPQGRLTSIDYKSTFFPNHDKFKDRLGCVQSLAQWNFWRLAQNVPVPCFVLAAKDDPLVPWTSLPIVRTININPFVVFALTERGAHGLFFTGVAPRPWSSTIAGDFMDAVGRTPCKIPTMAIQQWMGARA